MRLLRFIAELFCWFWLLSLVFAYASPYVDPRVFWMPAVFGLAYPLLAIISLFWVVGMLFLRARWWWALLLVLIAGFPFWSELYNTRGAAERIPTDSYEIVSFNTKVLGKYSEKDISDALFSFTDVRKPDIVCLQEVLIRPSELRKILKKTEYRHYWLTSYVEKAGSNQKFGKVTLSRHPVKGKGVLQIPGSPLRFANYLDVQLGHKTVRVFNVHLQKTTVTDTDYEFLQENLEDYERTWEFSIRLTSRLVRAFKLRAEQAEHLKTEIEKSPYPVIVCGDFNDTRPGFAYRTIANGMKDAFVKAGYGNGHSYRGPIPFLRLDYVLFSPTFKVVSYATFKDIPSDHKLLLVKFN
jgi:endonuclease/exonuclease/phosphatase family metal-dependent hydrolase